MTKLKSIKVQGKDYVTVAERVRHFNETYTNGTIQTEITFDKEIVRCKAIIWPDVVAPARFFTGHSEENRGDGMVNKTSAVENAETSAVGRALGFMGIGVTEGIASADEINKATAKTFTLNDDKLDATSPRKTCQSCEKEFSVKPGREWAKQCLSCWKETKPLKKPKEINDEPPMLEDYR